MSAVGALRGSLVRNTAVPETRCGGRFSSIATKSASGNSSLRDFSNRSLLPRRQVYISSMTTAPSASGTQPPSNTFKRFAARNVRSRNRNGAISAAADKRDHLQTIPMATKPIIAMTQIVQRQRRQDDEKPGSLDRPFAKMPEVGIQRLGTGDSEKHRAQRDEANDAVVEHERDSMERI